MHKIKGVNVAPVFGSLSANSSWFFWLLVEHRDYETNLCRALYLNLSKTEKMRIPRAYKELSSKSLIVRQSKETYRVNPKVLITKFECFDKTWLAWLDECRRQGVEPNIQVSHP